jgi:hypothetical protein
MPRLSGLAADDEHFIIGSGDRADLELTGGCARPGAGTALTVSEDRCRAVGTNP